MYLYNYIFVLSFVHVLQYTSAFEKLKEQLDRITNHQDEELLKVPKEKYNEAVSRKQGKVMFEHMDSNQDGFLSRAEMRHFGKVIFTEDVSQLDFWIRENFKYDENKDDMLTFEEFFQPQIHMGETTDPLLHQRDEL